MISDFIVSNTFKANKTISIVCRYDQACLHYVAYRDYNMCIYRSIYVPLIP